ncbi:diversity-generating retroelement protein Avd [Clostridium butyricum]|uniref:diversity-generating retroelement protein Avd n=1 Tax=Clostridium butyricum TaxID=1492 RepID=UPI003D354B7E
MNNTRQKINHTRSNAGKSDNNTTIQDSSQGCFILKEKIYEMILYGSNALMQFPKSERFLLSKDIRESMYTMLKLVITLENKTFKKTTLGDLDTEIDILRHMLRMSADKRLYPGAKPCMAFKKYEHWSKLLNEIGRMVGGYKKYIN